MAATNGCHGPIDGDSYETTAFGDGLDCRPVSISERNEKGLMMNGTHGWMGGGMWSWTVIGVLGAVLLIIVINKLSRK